MQTAGAGGYLQHYEYDGLNRLVKATGRDNTPYGDAQYSHYTMEMAYNAMSSPVKIEKNLNGTFIRNEYLYGLEEHPNAPQQVGERRYTYSASGNPLTIEGGDVNRTLTWDAENRLRRIYDSRSGQIHLYTYNHLGERALKRYGKAQAMAVNDKDAGALLDTKDNYSAYVSPYFVRHNNRYTKHYYAGAMRIASKIGASGSTYAAGTDEPDLYFYHTDHLGSTTYITDRKEVAQYVAYTPYGETFKEYKNVTPYKFNGKELDQETGYYYYGARYYDPGTALWLGVDPLQHKYPEVSPYVYCAGNPVKYVDPDGREKIVSFYTDGEGLEAESQRSVDNKVIMKSADNYYDNANSVAIWAHGYNDGKAMITYKGHTRNDIVSYFEFDKFLTENSNVYVDHAAEQKTTLVILHSCETGKENGFAQQMSDKLDLLIVAPTENVSVDRNTSKEIGVKNGGGWNVFYRGKKLDSFNGTTQPIFKNPEQIIDKYVQQYEKLYGKE